MNHYEILGVGPDATEQQIKEAYRREAMKWHPDRHDGAAAKGEADRRFKDLAVAYRTLRNPVDRANYDRQLDQKLRQEYEARQQEHARQQRAHNEQAQQRQTRQEPPQPDFADTGPQFEEQTASNEDANQMFYEQMLDLAFELAGRGFPEFNIFKALIALGCPEALAKAVAATAAKPGSNQGAHGPTNKNGGAASNGGSSASTVGSNSQVLRRPISTDWESLEPYFAAALVGPNFQASITEEFGIVKTVRGVLFVVLSLILFALLTHGETGDAETVVGSAIISALLGWGVMFGLLEFSPTHRNYVLTERKKNYLPKFKTIFSSKNKWKETSSAIWFPAPWFGYYGIIWPLVAVASIFFAVDFLFLIYVNESVHQKESLISAWEFFKKPWFYMGIWIWLGYSFNYLLFTRIKSAILKIESFQAPGIAQQLYDKCRPRLWRAFVATAVFFLIVLAPSEFIFPAEKEMLDTVLAVKKLTPIQMLEQAKPRFTEDSYQGTLSTTAALQMLRISADKGHVPAESFLGYIYGWGLVVTKNEKVSSYWIERAANHGDIWSTDMLGNMKYKGWGGYSKNEAEAVAHWRSAAELGSPSAQTSLGWSYMIGIGGTPIDFQKAASWNEKGANGGNAEGFNNLGWLYENGQGVPRNVAHAADLYRKAAELGSEQAKQRLLTVPVQ